MLMLFNNFMNLKDEINWQSCLILELKDEAGELD